MKLTESEALFSEAQIYIPGGVNSPVRAFRQVGGIPVFMERAQGPYLFDEDENRYIDYINSWGPMILGHGHPRVVEAVSEQVRKAFSFGAPTRLEVEMAKLITSMVPNVEMIRMVNSGTEACMSAVRLARGFTGKSKILKFDGHYHGHADMFLKKSGSGLATLGIKQSGGLTESVLNDTIVLQFNDFEILEESVKNLKDDLAAIIVEPVAGNMGCVLPKPGYLEHMRKLCTEYNIILIFDEVMTGFRLSKGGAQEIFGVWADLVTFGKIIGGGLPVGAFGGRRDIMAHVAPLGNVYQAGTLSGNPIAMAAGFATLSELNENNFIYKTLTEAGDKLKQGITTVLERKKIPNRINAIGSMISVHFCDQDVIDFTTASLGNNETFRNFFHHMLGQSVFLPPSAFESWFISAAITDENILTTIMACDSFEQGQI